MDNDTFTYDENAGTEKMEKLGIEWHGKVNLRDNLMFFSLKNDDFGEFIISENALDSIKEPDYYKVLSLILEQKPNKNIYSITLADERDKLQFKYDNYISLRIDEFLNRFPHNFIEIQQRSLINLYNQYPDYGQEIETISSFDFFVKNDSELFFILESMKKKGLIDVDVRSVMGGELLLSEPLVITDEGWLEIERTIKKNRKKQVFIAMKFKDMDNVYKAIYTAIDEASFSPLRIDKKEHINQISSEIQYEISQSGLVIADVTGQNQGVYYEAGYAMGLNIPVIWTCDDNEKDNVHFDIRQYNTIFWKDENELHEMLKKRIIAVMGLREETSNAN